MLKRPLTSVESLRSVRNPPPTRARFPHSNPNSQPSRSAPSASRAVNTRSQGMLYCAPNPGAAQQVCAPWGKLLGGKMESRWCGNEVAFE